MDEKNVKNTMEKDNNVKAKAKAKAKRRKFKKAEGLNLFFLKVQFSRAMRMRVYEKMGKFVKNGVPVPQALDTLYDHLSIDGKKPNAVGALIINQWRHHVLDGKALSFALRGWVPPSDLSIIEAGEISGRLDRAMEDVIFVNMAGKKMKGAVMGMAYPFVLIGMVVFYFYIFGMKVVPAFAGVLSPTKWQGGAKAMYSMSLFVQNQLAFWIIGFLVLMFIIISTMGIWTGKIRTYFDKVSPWSIYRLVNGSNFLISLASLITAGVAIPDALGIMAKSGSRWYRQRVEATRQVVLNGALNIGEALKKTGYDFPDTEMVIDIRSYAALDGFDEMLSKLARQWLDDTVLKIQLQIKVLQNVALLVLGVVFMMLISGVFALQMQVTKSVS